MVPPISLSSPLSFQFHWHDTFYLHFVYKLVIAIMKHPSPLCNFRGLGSHTEICSSLEHFEVKDILFLRIVQNTCAGKDYLSETTVWRNSYRQGQLLMIIILHKDLKLLTEMGPRSAKLFTTTTTGGAGAAGAACSCAIAIRYINFPKGTGHS